MIRTPYRAKGGAAQLGAFQRGRTGPFGIRPEPASEPDAPAHDPDNPPSAQEPKPSRLSCPHGP
ncbi:hypothetical protein GCM10018953_56670 [Streptosporangium nondiastaticum]